MVFQVCFLQVINMCQLATEGISVERQGVCLTSAVITALAANRLPFIDAPLPVWTAILVSTSLLEKTWLLTFIGLHFERGDRRPP